MSEKLRIQYYKASEQEREDYSDYNQFVTMKKIDFSKKSKELMEIKIILLIGFLMPVFWKLFEWYSETFAVWMLDVGDYALPFVMGCTFGLAFLCYGYIVQVKHDYDVGAKIVGVNFFKIHKQNTQFMSMFGFIALLVCFFVLSKMIGVGSECAEIDVFLASFILICLSWMSISNSFEYCKVLEHEFIKRLNDE